MSAPLAVQLSRLVTPERLPDRHIVSGVLASSEQRLLGDQVILAYLFEVMQPWLPSSQLLPTLTAAIEAEFPKLTSAEGSIDDHFELLLRTVNQNLNTLSETGETDWIGNLNGILVLFSGSEMHFSQTGSCPAYLLQNNRIRQITDDPAAGADTHPLKTFANLASGALQENDQVLIANHELYREISLDALRRILNTSSPYQATQQIGKELRAEKNLAVSSLIFKVSKTINTSEPEVLDLESEMQSGFKKFLKRIRPVAEKAKVLGSKAAEVTGKGVSKGVETWKTSVAPTIAEKLKPKAKEEVVTEPAVEEPTESTIVEIIPSRRKRERAQLAAIAEAAEARLTQEEEEEMSVIPVEERALEKAPNTLLVKVRDLATKALAGIVPFVRDIISWIINPKNRRVVALGGGVLIIILTVWIGIRVSHRGGSTASASTNTQILTDVQKLKDDATAAMQAEQSALASQDITKGLAALSTLKDPSSSDQKTADALWQALSDKADTLTTTTRLTTSAATYDLQSTAKGIFANLPYFYGWDTTNGKLYRTGQGDAKETQATIALSDSSDAIISAASTSESDTTGYALTKQGKVFRISQTGSTTNLRAINPASGEFALGDAISTYNGNLYILDGKAGLVWKYLNSGTSYSKGTSVIDVNKYDIKKSVSLTIDGSLYMLKSDGSIMKFTSGKQDTSFVVSNVPDLAKSFTQPTTIITSATYSSIYVLDAGSTSSPWSTARVLEFTKSGSYVRQFAFPKELNKVRAFDINPKDKKLWVLNDKTVFEFPI